jgi:hypothetical protein
VMSVIRALPHVGWVVGKKFRKLLRSFGGRSLCGF